MDATELEALQRAFMDATGLEEATTGPVPVAGATKYQEALVAVVGREPRHWAEYDCEAQLVAEPTNPKDVNAIAVYIEGHHVGYLPAGSEAPAASTVPARIKAGWRHDDDSTKAKDRKRYYTVVLWPYGSPTATDAGGEGPP